MAALKSHKIITIIFIIISLQTCNTRIYKRKPLRYIRYSTTTLPTITSTPQNDKVHETSTITPTNRNYLVLNTGNANEGDVPYQVSLKKKNMDHICGGCIINNRWILTAAHCLLTKPQYATMGSVLLNSGGVTMEVGRTFSHPNYNRKNKENDIGLIKLNATLEFDSFISALSLPSRNIETGETAILSGWGYLDSNIKGVTDNLQIFNVTTISNEECSKPWKFFKIFSSNVCVNPPSGKAVCLGDSGGPLAADGVIHGIVSYGSSCNLGYPEVLTRVYKFKDWITSTINNNQ